MTQQSEALLECKNVSFRYPEGDWILQDVNLTVRRGERVGLVGTSGYGKSTLSRLLAGYETPVNGRSSGKENRSRIGDTVRCR